MPIPERETARLLLRGFAPADLDDLAAILHKPEVMKFLGAGQAVERAEAEEALHSMNRHWERHGFGRWAVVHKAERKLIGFAGLRSFHGTPELMYLLDRAYWGLGLATEVAEFCLHFGFREQGFDRITAFVRAGNVASRRVIMKVGMRFERKMKFTTALKMLGVKGKGDELWPNAYIMQYALSRDEYEEMMNDE